MHRGNSEVQSVQTKRAIGAGLLTVAMTMIIATAIFGPLTMLAAANVSPADAGIEREDTDRVAHVVHSSVEMGASTGVTPALQLSKYTNGVVATQPPGPEIEVNEYVTWTYLITNTGNVTLTNLTLIDSDPIVGQIVPRDCDSLLDVMSAGKSIRCTVMEIAKAGQYSNTAVVTGTSILSPSIRVTATAISHYFGLESRLGITITKYTNGLDVVSPPGPSLLKGDPITWTYRITNTGDQALAIELTDAPAGAADINNCTPNVTNGLAPRSATTCTLTGTVTTTGQYSNTAVVTGTANVRGSQRTVSADDRSFYYGLQASLQVAKLTNGARYTSTPGALLKSGASVTWTYKITNTGGITLTNLVIHDNREVSEVVCTPPIIPPIGAVLAPGATLQCSRSGVVSLGQYSNTVIVSGTSATSPPKSVGAADTSYYFGSASSMKMTAAPAVARVGDEITITLVITGRVTNQALMLRMINRMPEALRPVAGSANRVDIILDLNQNQVRWTYTPTVGSASPVTITYRARLTTGCSSTVINRAELYEDAAQIPVDLATAAVGIATGETCNVYLPHIYGPGPDPLPNLVSGNFSVEGQCVSNVVWPQLINGVAGQLIFKDGDFPFTAHTPPCYAFLGGVPSQTNQLRQSLTQVLPQNYEPGLEFFFVLGSQELTCTDNERIEVRIYPPSAQIPFVIGSIQLCRPNATQPSGSPIVWTLSPSYSLNSFRGQRVTIEFFSIMNDGLNSVFLIDDVTLCAKTNVEGVQKCTDNSGLTRGDSAASINEIQGEAVDASNIGKLPTQDANE